MFSLDISHVNNLLNTEFKEVKVIAINKKFDNKKKY